MIFGGKELKQDVVDGRALVWSVMGVLEHAHDRFRIGVTPVFKQINKLSCDLTKEQKESLLRVYARMADKLREADLLSRRNSHTPLESILLTASSEEMCNANLLAWFGWKLGLALSSGDVLAVAKFLEIAPVFLGDRPKKEDMEFPKSTRKLCLAG